MSIIRVPAGERCYISSGPELVNTIDPWIGVRNIDLTPDGLGTVPMRVNFSNIGGKSFVPKQATSFRVFCHLMRGLSPSNGGAAGGSDISLCAEFWGYPGQPHMNFGASYANGGSVPLAALVESCGGVVEFPNIIADDGSWANFYWQMRGSTPLGSACMLDLISFDVPIGSAPLDTIYPQMNSAPSSLMLYFEGNLLDSSPYAHPMLQHNSGLTSDGGAFFDGTSSFQTITGSLASFDFSGDFTIEIQFKTNRRAVPGSGIQQRILSFGSAPSIGIWIDPASGGVVCGSEFIAPLKTGSIPVDLNRPMVLKWTRHGTGTGNNILTINGFQDGPAFTDNTHFTISDNGEIGRLHGNNSGYFSGEIYNINIVNGLAI